MAHSARAMVTVLALGGILSGVAGCARHAVEPGPGGVVVKRDRIGWYLKKVVAKEAPSTLMADDATICLVSPERFRATSTGTMIHCNWQ